MLSELGVAILLLAIGLETDLHAMMRVGVTSLAVAVVGVVLPFGSGLRRVSADGPGQFDFDHGGGDAHRDERGDHRRVLSDLGRLRDVEGQIILGAAVIDDILGLIILTVVGGMIGGGTLTVGSVAWTTAAAFGFLAVTLVVGSLITPWVVGLASKIDLPGTPTIFALTLALGLAWLAEKSGSALIIGAFVAGVLLAKTSRAHEIEKGITYPRPFLRAAVLRGRGRFGRSQRPESDGRRRPMGPGGGVGVDRLRRGRQDGGGLRRRSGSAVTNG